MDLPRLHRARPALDSAKGRPAAAVRCVGLRPAALYDRSELPVHVSYRRRSVLSLLIQTSPRLCHSGPGVAPASVARCRAGKVGQRGASVRTVFLGAAELRLLLAGRLPDLSAVHLGSAVLCDCVVARAVRRSRPVASQRPSAGPGRHTASRVCLRPRCLPVRPGGPGQPFGQNPPCKTGAARARGRVRPSGLSASGRQRCASDICGRGAGGGGDQIGPLRPRIRPGPVRRPGHGPDRRTARVGNGLATRRSARPCIPSRPWCG